MAGGFNPAPIFSSHYLRSVERGSALVSAPHTRMTIHPCSNLFLTSSISSRGAWAVRAVGVRHLPHTALCGADEVHLCEEERCNFIVSYGMIKGKGLQFSGTNFVDKTSKPPESTHKTTFLVLSRIWYKFFGRAWSSFP